MRKLVAIAFSFFVALAAIIFLAPFFLPIEGITAGVLDAVSREIRGSVTMGEAKWRWFPAPGLKVTSIRVETNEISAVAAEVFIRPSVRSLIARRFLAVLDIQSPEVRIKALPEGEGGKFPSRIPVSLIRIRDGGLRLDEKWASRLREGVFACTGIYADVHLAQDEISFSGSFHSPFVRKADVKGIFRPSDCAYEATLRGEGIRPHLLVPVGLSRDGLFPLDSELSLNVHIKGRGTDHYTARVQGGAPCLTLRPEGRRLAFSCGYFDALVRQDRQGLGIEVFDLRATDPALSLKGTLSRMPAEDGYNIWKVDLSLRDVDLAGVREKALALFGGVKRVRKLCDVIRSGTARQLQYRFAGRSTELGRIEDMTVTALLEDAEIHVPHPDLYLDRVSGSIQIEDGRLSGRGLAASLGKITWKNGSLLMGLTNKDDVFRLDGDFQGKVAEVPSLLERLFSRGIVREELPRIGEVTGGASIHLSIGDDRKQPTVRILIQEADCAIAYGRLPWPVSPRKGEVVISPGEITWSGISGLFGPHEVKASAGSVTWHEGIRVELKSLSGSMDLGPMYEWLAAYPRVARVLAKVVTTAEGRLDVNDASFIGSTAAPESWEYEVRAKARTGVTFESPLLPGTVRVEAGSATITQGALLIQAVKGGLDGQPVEVSGDLVHDRFRNWRGRLVLAGTARKGLAHWIEEKGWIPGPYFPAVPCKVSGLEVSWGDGSVSVRGKISPEGPRETPVPEASIDLVVHKGALRIRSISIRDGDSAGDLSLDLRGPPKRSFSLGFSGEVNGRSLDQLLRKNDVLHGELAGAFRAKYDPARPLSGEFDGRLVARDLVWGLGLARPVLVKELALRAEETRTARIDRFVLAYDGESVEGSGKASMTGDGLSLDLVVGGGHISSGMIRDVLAPASEGRDAGDGTKGLEKGKDNGSWKVRAQVQVSLDAFDLVRPEKGPLVFSPLVGVLVIDPTERTRFDVTRAGLCGLDVDGAVDWVGGDLDIDVTIRAASGPEKVLPRFETTLSCLGLGQDVIEGGFLADIRLVGRYPMWDTGSVVVTSTGGRIRRLTLLAKVFSLVNVLDIFSDGLPDLFAEGFSYDRLEMKGTIAKNALEIEQLYVNGKGLNIFAEGKVDLAKFDSDITLLIAPFKTVDFVLRNIPIIGRVFGGKNGAFISIPVGVRGPLADPSVTVLPPGAVGSGLVGFVERTVRLPFTILSPLVPSNEKERAK